MQGEWMGTHNPGTILLGRRGQILNFNPFDGTGNFNTIVVGDSGSGKSVFMQELMMNGLGTGAKVYVLDVGRSFEKLCDVIGGQKIEFNKGTTLCLNPFTNIPNDPEERLVAFSGIKSIISCMAAPSEGTTDYQNAFIEMAIARAWEEKGRKAQITDVGNILLNEKEKEAYSLGTMLTPYMKNGNYGHYFDGDSNVNFNENMVLIELEELKGRKDLQSVILQIFIMEISNRVFMGDRKTPTFICIDEAWDLLKGEQTGPFIETLARRLRKYRGSLVIGTQSLEDFFKSTGAKAAYDNSDWMCLLKQKPSSLKKAVDMDIFDENKRRALETVIKKGTEYSEVMICDAHGGYSIARTILDPFSKLLYSTIAEDYADLQALKEQGKSTIEALKIMLERRK